MSRFVAVTATGWPRRRAVAVCEPRSGRSSSTGPAPYLAAIWRSLLVIVAVVVWVMRCDEVFRGSGDELGRKPTRASTRAPRVRAVGWSLGLTGRTETMFFWKNAMQTLRDTNLRIDPAVPVPAIMFVVVGIATRDVRHRRARSGRGAGDRVADRGGLLRAAWTANRAKRPARRPAASRRAQDVACEIRRRHSRRAAVADRVADAVDVVRAGLRHRVFCRGLSRADRGACAYRGRRRRGAGAGAHRRSVDHPQRRGRSVSRLGADRLTTAARARRHGPAIDLAGGVILRSSS